MSIALRVWRIRQGSFTRSGTLSKSATAPEADFRATLRKSQHCIIPAAAIYEPYWRSGKAKTTRFYALTVSLWADCTLRNSEEIHNFNICTMNADDHPPT